MSYLEPTELQTPRISPFALLGAASPLWAYFGCATAGGVAYWWMTRWTAQAANLEALFHAGDSATQPLAEAVGAAQSIIEQTADAAADALVEAVPPVGGESAPFGQVEAVIQPPAEAAVEAVETGAQTAEAAGEAFVPTVEATQAAGEETFLSTVEAPQEAAESPRSAAPRVRKAVPPTSPSTH